MMLLHIGRYPPPGTTHTRTRAQNLYCVHSSLLAAAVYSGYITLAVCTGPLPGIQALYGVRYNPRGQTPVPQCPH
eukprot:472599-Rhodomonas_salina.1